MRKTLIYISIMMLVLVIPSVYADDYEPADEPENSTNEFILDADNSGGDIELQFGGTLAEFLRWNDTQSYFELSDDLVIDGNSNLNGNIFRLDFDNVGVGADVDIIAEQGSDSDGTLRYSAANNRWEISNDGGGFNEVLTSASSTIDADTLDTLDSLQFLRSDTSDSFTSGTLSTGAATSLQVDGLLDANGVITLGDGGDNVTIDSSVWDITLGGIASGFTGITSSGSVDFGSASSINVPHTTSTSFTLDNDNAGVGATVDIIAEQGTDANGTLRYNASTNRWELSNDGGSFYPLHAGAFFSGYDSTGNVSLSTTEAVLNIDTSHFIDNPPFSLSGDVLTMNQDGVYKIDAHLTVDSLDTSAANRSSIELRVELDPAGGGVVFSDIPGALCQDYKREQGNGVSSASCALTLIDSFSSGDSIRLTHRMNGTTTGQTVPEGSGLSVQLLRPE